MGMIFNENRAKQIIDFEGLSFGKLHPTDFDAIIELDNEYLILVEVKSRKGGGMPNIPLGQKLALNNVAKAWSESRKSAVVVYASHDTNDKEVIYLRDTLVESVYNADNGVIVDYNKKQTFKHWLKNLTLFWDSDKLRGLATVIK